MNNKGGISIGLLIVILLIAVSIIAVTATISSDDAKMINAQYIEGTTIVNGDSYYLSAEYNQAIDENYDALVAAGAVNGRYHTNGRGGTPGGPDGPDDPTPPPPSPPPGPESDDDFRPQSMAVANTFKSTTYVQARPDATADANGRYFNYSQGAGSYTIPTYNSISCGCNTLHRDCSCYCSAMLVLCGFRSSWGHFTSSTISGAGTLVTVSTMGQLQPGDILRKSGHVAMVVYKDSQYVYVGDFGSASTTSGPALSLGLNGDKTAAQGWSYRYSLSTPWVNGHQNKVEGGHTSYTTVVRP